MVRHSIRPTLRQHPALHETGEARLLGEKDPGECAVRDLSDDPGRGHRVLQAGDSV